MTNNALHGFQQQLVDCVSKGQNHIIVAPTGSGKTRVAVEVAGLLFQRKPSARILFLTPTVALAEQQTGEHLAVCTEQACRDGLAVQMRAICCSACHLAAESGRESAQLVVVHLHNCFTSHFDLAQAF